MSRFKTVVITSVFCVGFIALMGQTYTAVIRTHTHANSKQGGTLSGSVITSAVATATALAANGANCTVGNYPLGVDASGAVESCTAVITTPGSDSETIARSTSSTFQAVTGTSVLPLTGWTRVNGALLNNFSANEIITTVQGNASINYRFITRSVPDSTFTIIARMHCPLVQNTNTSTCGIYLTDGTKLEGMEATSQGGVIGTRFATAATVTTSPTVVIAPTTPGEFDQTVKIVEDGTHTTWSYWENGAFVQFTQRNTHTFLTPSNVGFGGVDVINASTASINHLLYYCYAASSTTCDGQ